MSERPNWGWGEHQPVPMFTEDEILQAIRDLHAGSGTRIIAKLKENRHGRQEAQHSHVAVGGKEE